VGEGDAQASSSPPRGARRVQTLPEAGRTRVSRPSGLAAVVAARNEADAIAETLRALRRTLPGAALWVADDASTDGTGEIAIAAGAQLVTRRRPHGKGANVTTAAQAALGVEPAPDLVLLCDADLGPTAAELGRLTEAVERGDCDLAIAAFRERAGGGLGLAVGFARRAIERRCGFVARAPLSGQRAMRAAVLRAALPLAPGFGMETGITIDAVRAGFRVAELELELAHRTTGRTPAGFVHRARQLLDAARADWARRERA
jgi:glycosyltransferase involved in cell wall biosynthesis